MKNPKIYFPFLFAVFPILFLLSHNKEELSFNVVFLSIVSSLFAVALMILVLYVLFQSWHRGALFVFFITFIFFSYGHFCRLIPEHTFFSRGILIGRDKLLYTIIIFLTAAFFFFVRKIKKETLFSLTKLLNWVTFFLALLVLLQIGIYKSFWFFKLFKINSTSKKAAREIIVPKTNQPDIYYIILDTYARSDVLKNLYNFDNSKFENLLRTKGFYIPRDSKSNYAITFLSLASSLNMEYINYLTEEIGLNSGNRSLPYKMIKDSRVREFLKTRGYRIINFRSGWGPTHNDELADQQLGPWNANEFITVLFETTLLLPWEFKIIGNPARERILYAFRTIGQLAREPGPKFILAHFLVPHSPYLFGRHGEVVTGLEYNLGGGENKKRYYINQLIFVNKKISEMVEQILNNSKQKPIIILQADHGAFDIDENIRFKIFSAFYLPGIGNEFNFPSITPVNIFRIIFNHYFGANFPLLENHCFYSLYSSPYRFSELNSPDL